MEPRTPATSRPAAVLVSIPSPSVHESHSTRLPLVKEQNQVSQVPSEAVQPPADDGFELVPTHVSGKPVQRRSAVFRSAHAVIDVLGSRPSAGLDVPTGSRSWFSVVCSNVLTRA